MESIQNYNMVISYISKAIRPYFENIADEIKEKTYEIRLRSCRPASVFGAYGTLFVTKEGTSKYPDNAATATPDDINNTFSRICAYSIHTFQRCINSGYIPMEKGNRAGICGTAICEKETITAVRNITSINIRIANECKGCADEIIKRFNPLNESVIIAGPPSSGKTTIIRDIVRQISSGYDNRYIKTAVIDERKEISGVSGGIITNDIGITSDVLDSYPKSDAIDIAVRTLSPEVIVCDEISTEYEINAIKTGVNCGVKFIVTVHAGDENEIYSRKQIEELISTFSFKKLFLLNGVSNIGKIRKEYEAGEIINEINNRHFGSCGLYTAGN